MSLNKYDISLIFKYISTVKIRVNIFKRLFKYKENVNNFIISAYFDIRRLKWHYIYEHALILTSLYASFIFNEFRYHLLLKTFYTYISF